MRRITGVLRLTAHGLSYRQIGQSFNVSASTVQGYVKRAQRVGLSWPLPDDQDGLALHTTPTPCTSSISTRVPRLIGAHNRHKADEKRFANHRSYRPRCFLGR